MSTDLSQADLSGGLFAERYRFVRLLGAGGMGRVYLAEDEVLHRRVAVKLLQPHHAADPRFVERFRREARAAAALSHPHVVSVHDLGEADGVPYIVMQYVEGRTLKDAVRREGRLPEPEARRVCLEVLEAAGHAHRHGIVHRDLSARNILLDGRGRVLVVDFGIARLGSTPFTTGATMLGTAQYAAPEQVRGLGADARSDLYTVGVVLSEMLTGSLPFDGDDAMAVALKHVHDAPPRPSSLVPGISASMEAVVLKAMAKDPAARYQTAEEFASALRAAGGVAQASDGEATASPAFTESVELPVIAGAAAPTQAEPAVPETATQLVGEAGTAVLAPRRPDRARRRRRAIVLVAAALVVAAAAGMAAFWYLGRAQPLPDTRGKPGDAAAAQLRTAGFDVSFADGVFSDAYAKGSVAGQSPSAGVELRKGGSVSLTLSLGPVHFPAPDLTGLAAADAEKLLKQEHLVGSPLKGRSDAVAVGEVFRQQPSPGDRVARGDAVTYWVSTGPAAIEVPDVTGQYYGDAEATLKAMGLKVDTRASTGWGTTPLDVVEQEPAAGSRVPPGSTVIIWVAIL